ncbi:hypothetical protein [Ruminiclostridium sufflavum]|uniref:hypothetical protein n=1 Tax=Ruminiclostridium sufflavum TaxID=396504 RepID=UPI001057F923|nr:hypothetical protein [Ruminiclostridium sufflavum]
MIRKRKSVALFLARKFLPDKSTKFIVLNKFQKNFIEKYQGKSNSVGFICLEGAENTGKTTAVINLMESLWKYVEKDCDIEKILNATIINCSTNQEEILFLFSRDRQEQRISKFSNNLVVIDNIEKMSPLFIEDCKELFQSQKSFFILIYNRPNQKNINTLKPTDSFDNAIPSFELDNFNIMNSVEKDLLLIICILSDITYLVYKKEIYSLLDHLPNRIIKKSLNHLIKRKIINAFAFNDHYIYKSQNLNINQYLIDNPRDDLLLRLIKSNQTDIIYKWSFLLNCSEKSITGELSRNKASIFNQATNTGSYRTMYTLLNKKSEQIQNLFLYEKAILSFYMGEHKESHIILNELLSQSSPNRKEELKLAVIQATHGSSNRECVSLIQTYLAEMECKDTVYGCIARYWRLHIDTEMGIFNYEPFLDIIYMLKTFDSTALTQNTIQRCYTDYIRCCHIVGEKCNDSRSVISNFIKFLSVNPIKKQYYENLYLKANAIHYIEIPNAFLRREKNTEGLVNSAKTYYEDAICCNYGDDKSVAAAELKMIDLQICYSDFDFANAKIKIQKFKRSSLYNEVDVFVAYSCTLLVKLHITAPQNMSNDRGLYFEEDTLNEIESNYYEGLKIYEKFKNTYGVFRLKFLYCLFKLYRGSPSSQVLSEMNILLQKNHNLKRENAIYDALKRDGHEKMYILGLIKSYPIILQ